MSGLADAFKELTREETMDQKQVLGAAGQGHETLRLALPRYGRFLKIVFGVKPYIRHLWGN